MSEVHKIKASSEKWTMSESKPLAEDVEYRFLMDFPD